MQCTVASAWNSSNLMAMSTSSLLTYSRKCMAAWASLIRMMDSRWRTAMGMPWLMADSRRRSAYTCRQGSGVWVFAPNAGWQLAALLLWLMAVPLWRASHVLRVRLQAWQSACGACTSTMHAVADGPAPTCPCYPQIPARRYSRLGASWQRLYMPGWHQAASMLGVLSPGL